MNPDINNSCALILAASYVNYTYSKNHKKSYLYLNSGLNLALEKIMRFYVKCKIPIFVAVDNDQEIPEYEAFKNCNFIKIKFSNSIFDTLKFSIKEISKLKYENIIINPIQVIPSDRLRHNSISISKSPFRKGNWTSIEIKSSNIEFIYRDDINNEGKFSYAFTGRINAEISHITNFFNLSISPESNDLGYLASYLFKKFRYKFQKEIWLDLSHDALLTETKLQNISCRDFHSLEYCKERNLITKYHTNEESFFDTVAYYKKLDRKFDIKRFFPTFIDLNSKKRNKSYTLEYIPFPTLSELFLHECLDHHIWEKIISRMKNIYDEIYLDSNGTSEISSKKFFTDKFLKREELFINLLSKKKYSLLKRIYLKPYKVNSIQMPSLKNSFKNILNLLYGIEINSELWFGHGDLCFNNILMDPYSLSTKLIDPKALNNLGKKYIGFVPRNYDLAKLNHSFIGLYDSIIANMYSINIIEENNFKFNIFHPNKHKFIKEIFKEIFFGNNKKNITDVNIITANLFFSMLPLHSEDPKRMLAFAMIGNAIFESKENYSSKIFK